MIHVEPERSRRRDFAAWAVAQDPKVRTASAHAFAVPEGLFTAIPEALLIGSRVDGHRYISPEEDEQATVEAGPVPVGGDLLGVATSNGFREAAPGEVLPEATASYGANSVHLEPASSGPAHQEDSDAGEERPPFVCLICSREFTTERGRETHQRRAHPTA